MRIEWDPRKAAANLRKHGVRFSDAEAVLFDPVALTRDDPGSRREARFVTVGTDVLGRVVVVVYTYRGEAIRLISARRATGREWAQYEEGIRL
ncbi:MAG: BrnT family toxin [Candidatus Krumholzibacteriia bacterium]